MKHNLFFDLILLGIVDDVDVFSIGDDTGGSVSTFFSKHLDFSNFGESNELLCSLWNE